MPEYRSEDSIRLEKYKLLAEGYDSVSVHYLAEAVGVSVPTAAAELSRAIANGAFPGGAYLDYPTMTLVLRRPATRENAQRVYGAAGNAVYESAQAVSRAVQEGARVVSQAAYTGAKTVKEAVNEGKRAASSYSYRYTPQRSAPKKQASPKPAPKAEEKPVKTKKPYRKQLRTGVIMTGIGVLFFAAALDNLYSSVLLTLMGMGVGFTAAGSGFFISRDQKMKRDLRLTKYKALLKGRTSAAVSQLAGAAGLKLKKARKELDYFTSQGLLGDSAYVDRAADVLYLSPPPEEKPKEEKSEPVDSHQQILRELRRLDEEIADELVSGLICSIERSCAKIFQFSKEHPERQSELKTFMGFYLPTSLKLLRNYATLEHQGVSGENIDAAMQSIVRSLSTLESAFRVQLDKLFAGVAMDAETDEDVIDSMLRRDGLGKGDFEAKSDE